MTPSKTLSKWLYGDDRFFLGNVLYVYKGHNEAMSIVDGTYKQLNGNEPVVRLEMLDVVHARFEISLIPMPNDEN